MKRLIKSKILSLIALLALSTATSSQAAILMFSGTLTQNGFTGGPNIIPGSSTTVIGNWAFSFNNSVVTGSGLEFFTVNMTSFTLNSNIGSTVFNSSNTQANIGYNNGSLLANIVIGGSINGTGTPSAGVANDFSVTYVSTSVVQSMRVTNLGVNETAVGQSPFGSYSVVPEPSSLALVVGGMAVIFLRRKRSASQD